MEVTREYLQKKYIEQKLSISELVKLTGLSKDQLKGMLRRMGIRKTALKLRDAIYDDRDWLYDQYMVQNKGYSVIANEQRVSYTTILDRIHHFGWPIRGHEDIDKGAARRGHKHSLENRLRWSQERSQKVTVICAECGREKLVPPSQMKDLNWCTEECRKIWLFKNRKLPTEFDTITDSQEYRDWRLVVFKRDGYRCKMPGCGSQSREIDAHHIHPKSKYPELVFDTRNGITLCKPCHRLTYGKEEAYIEVLVPLARNGQCGTG